MDEPVPLDTLWDISITELDDILCRAGVESVESGAAATARDLDAQTREALVAALRASVSQARAGAPPVAQWVSASESLLLGDDGGPAARQRADAFWLRLTQIVYGCLVLVMLGDRSELPFFIELLRYQPAGHLAEMATDVLRRYVDPSHEMDTLLLLQRAEEWLACL
jgi:hypothetical protein